MADLKLRCLKTESMHKRFHWFDRLQHSRERYKRCPIHTVEFHAVFRLSWSQVSNPHVYSIVHSKLDYCNSVYHNLPNCQRNRLQQIQNSLARAVVKAPKSSHVNPILWSLHWLQMMNAYWILTSLVLPTKFLQPVNLAISTDFSLQLPRSTHSSSVVTVSRPPSLLIQICITSPLESTSRFISSA